MLRSIILLMCVCPSYIYSGEFPQHVVIKDVLEESEMNQLNQLTDTTKPELLWYGRYNFWKENFEAKFDEASQNISVRHSKDHECNNITDKLSKIFLMKIQEMGVQIAQKRIALLSYLDRNVVNIQNVDSSGMFWHQDSIIVDGQEKIADFTLILLMNGKIKKWSGANVVLQKGGKYSESGASHLSWINSDHPEVTITPCYNQAILFKNSDAAHMVTPLTPLSEEPVHRDVFILNCFFQ